MRDKLVEEPPKDNVTKILRAGFHLQEVVDQKKFLIIPKSERDLELMKMLKEYMQVMESVRFNRWLKQVKPQHFQRTYSK